MITHIQGLDKDQDLFANSSAPALTKERLRVNSLGAESSAHALFIHVRSEYASCVGIPVCGAKMVQQLRHSHFPGSAVCQSTAKYQSGAWCWSAGCIRKRTVKVAVTSGAQKTQAKILDVYFILLPVVFTYQLKHTQERA